jgi:hypothetical protein
MRFSDAVIAGVATIREAGRPNQRPIQLASAEDFLHPAGVGHNPRK